ncbi:uncharacterized protein LAESUDRAFT_649275 [Laetiporus sulphureus 93-53]|uniref:Uncharacterized protein n=1 Tax=Laetiporus sulphureus 93-53 TaxID=1314785 RepID=A0A165F5N3_9APHY|nr:uncharacterized protein LAESUDRAFT_649275 [Laetiporus sulphureus 93-53]KZT08437.1 hypothetical protein LAESUDRAFT_649275 [Laetiporus sulphureus 93-53]
MTDSDPLTAFLPLDELLQVIYQGSSRFVVLSSVDDTSWTVHIGLTGDEGRWWRGRWTDEDIRKGAVNATSMDDFADSLADAFVQGELYIGNWSSRKGAHIDFVLGTNTSSPAHVPLVELSPEEAAAFATKVFATIAVQAQSRKCRLHPSPYDTPRVKSGVTASEPAGAFDLRTASSTDKEQRTLSDRKDEEIKALKAELAREKSIRSISPESPVQKHKRQAEEEPETPPNTSKLTKSTSIQETSKLKSIAKSTLPSAATTHRGASLANPSQKARKYQALEFGSDED